MFVGSINEILASTLCAAPELDNILAEPTEVENRSGLFMFPELLRAGLNYVKL